MRIIKRVGEAAHNGCIVVGDDDTDSYDETLHIIAVFILLVVSLFGAAFAVVTTKVRCLRINPIVINIGKFFGSGVVLATGFIHMLPSGMEALTNDCLSEPWDQYGAFAGLFAMLAGLIMHLIEFIAHQHYLPHRVNEAYPLLDDKYDRYRGQDMEYSESGHHHEHGLSLQDENQNRKISTYLLEFGIALHSVLIGLALGTTTESFIPLLIAINFHQFFEAIALGAQIARIDHISFRSAIFMVLFFSITTPVGIAIGIAVHSTTYNPDSELSLLINGIFDSVSAGILIYVALVNLINAEMGVGAHQFHSLSNGLKFVYFLSLYAGVAAMSVIGLWA